MMEKHNHQMRCAEDKKCDRGKHDRRGLMQRFSDAMFGGPGEMQDKEDRDTEVRVMADLMIPQEICEERGGEWVDEDGRSDCVWPEYDRDCDKGEDREDDRTEQDDQSDERDGDSDESSEGGETDTSSQTSNPQR